MTVAQFHICSVERRVSVVRNDHRCHESMAAGLEDGFVLFQVIPLSSAFLVLLLSAVQWLE
jgi:hypothetical protein